MKSHVAPILLCAMTGCALVSTARAANYCVSNAAGFNAALAASAANGQDDRILLASGTYAIPDAFGYSFTLEAGHALTIEGGYIVLDGACEGPAKGTGLTVLDGLDQGPVLVATANAGAGSLAITNLTIEHGFAATTLSAGLRVYGASGFEGSLLIDDVVFQHNASGYAPAAYLQTTGAGLIRVRDVVVVHNSGSTAMQLSQPSGGTIAVVHGTFADNSGAAVNSAAVQCSGPGPVVCSISNSIFQDNLAGGTPRDADVSGKGFFHSIVENPGGPLGGFGNSTIAATFVNAAADDYRLAGGSRGINEGLSSPFGGLPSSDIDGQSRVVGSAPDLGAHESAVLLRDSFE